jgi:hypothetical protein
MLVVIGGVVDVGVFDLLGPDWDGEAADRLVRQVASLRSALGEVRDLLAEDERRAETDWNGPAHDQFVTRSATIHGLGDSLADQLLTVPGIIADAGEAAAAKRRHAWAVAVGAGPLDDAARLLGW